MARHTPSYQGLEPASKRASRAARGASRKSGTRPEMALRRALWRAGCRFRTDVAGLPGRPDVVFTRARVAIFCDGDFWHGKDWDARRASLEEGANPAYWVAKIERNIERDGETTRSLTAGGWTVLRFWESDLRDALDRLVAITLEILAERGHRRRQARRRRRLDTPRPTGHNGANGA